MYDAIVIGSGFGGAAVACRLAERGRSVLVLERGRRWGRTDFPRPGQENAPWWFESEARSLPAQAGPLHEARGRKLGIYERRRFPNLQVIVAAGVGGGSLVYTNVQKVPPAPVFRDWPSPISLDYLRPYYERVREMLEPTPVPHDLQRIRAFEQAHARARLPGHVERPDLAIRWPTSPDSNFAEADPSAATHARRLVPSGAEGSLGVGGATPDDEVVNKFGAAQQPCNLCGTCVFGCERHAKNTLDLTYLKRAESLGAEVWPLCEVVRIAPQGSGYEVAFRRLSVSVDAERQGGKEAGRQRDESVAARSVFLAAGSLGTTELLLRARDLDRRLPALSPRLGHNWSANGDFFAGLLNSREPVIPTLGPSVAAAADATDLGFYLMEGAIPSSLVASRKSLVALFIRRVTFLYSHTSRRPLEPAAAASCGDREAEELLSHLGAFFLMGRDASDGRLVLDAKGELQLLWDWRESEPLLGRMRRYLEELGRGYGGSMLIPQPWWPTTLGTVHPLGGCPMGRDASEGVADAFGRIFGYSNLYVCDGSLIPRALGVPPSMTIAALAEHIAENVTRDS